MSIHFSPDELQQAKAVDLLTYLRQYEPQELVHLSGDNYCTRTHDSLKISNGMWYWFSQGIGGRSALDYLIKVKGMSFPDAVGLLLGIGARQPLGYGARLPPASSSGARTSAGVAGAAGGVSCSGCAVSGRTRDRTERD